MAGRYKARIGGGGLRDGAVEVARLRAQVARLRPLAALLNTAEDAIFTTDLLGMIRSWQAGAAHLYGYDPAEVLGRPATLLLPAEQTGELAAVLARVQQGERVTGASAVHRDRNGQPLPVALTVAPLRDSRGQFTGAIVRASATLAQDPGGAPSAPAAHHDPLTGLPNRALLQERLEQALRTVHHANATLALLIMDLDRFREVNDTLGHPVGDELLQQVAARLQAALRPGDLIARLGGDEFAVLLPAAEERAASRISRRLLQALDAPVILSGHSLDVPLSIGIALYPEQGLDAATLMRRADVAMYLAKRNGSGYALYTPEEDPYSPARLTLISELRQAIARGELVLYYQPLVSHSTGRITMVEALIRWRHPARGLLQPDAFLPLAAHAGMIGPLTYWVLNTALRQARGWQDCGWDLPIAVNLSLEDLRDPYLPATVERLLRAWGVPAHRLCIEITENVAMSELAHTLSVLGALRAIGVQLAIDDFGIGYSSLAQLKRLPVDQLKIDQLFVRDLPQNAPDTAIVHAIIELGHSLGLRVVAEGVSDCATWDALTQLGCDEAQGYYLGHPLAAGALAERWGAQGWQVH